MPFTKKGKKTSGRGQEEETPMRKTRKTTAQEQKEQDKATKTKEQKEQDTESDQEQEPDQDDGRDKSFDEITSIMEEAGAERRLINKVLSKCKEIVAKMSRDQYLRIKHVWKTEQDKEEELKLCGRSVIIHDADKLVDKYMNQEDKEWDSRYTLAEKTVGVLTNLTNGMVTVTDSFSLGQRSEDKTPTSVCLRLGSPRQKGTLFKTLATMIGKRNPYAEVVRRLVVRDVFPKDKLQDVKRLATSAMDMKRDGKIAFFKVMPTGPQMIPVLHVKTKDERGRCSTWKIYVQED